MLKQLGATYNHPYVTVREHRPSEEVTLSDAEAEMLRTHLKGKIDVFNTPTIGEYILQAHEHVGFFVLPTNRVIEIRPKVQIDVLFALLARTHGMAHFQAAPYSYSSISDLFEFVVAHLVGMIEHIVANGIRRSFEPEEGEL